jgi:hypothetical protein
MLHPDSRPDLARYWWFLKLYWGLLEQGIGPLHGICCHRLFIFLLFIYLVCEAIGTAATPGLLCQPRVIVKMIVEKQVECRLAGETEVLGENLPQRHFCPSQNPTWPDPVLNQGRRGGKPAANRLSYGAAKCELNVANFLLRIESPFTDLKSKYT